MGNLFAGKSYLQITPQQIVKAAKKCMVGISDAIVSKIGASVRYIPGSNSQVEVTIGNIQQEVWFENRNKDVSQTGHTIKITAIPTADTVNANLTNVKNSFQSIFTDKNPENIGTSALRQALDSSVTNISRYTDNASISSSYQDAPNGIYTVSIRFNKGFNFKVASTNPDVTFSNNTLTIRNIGTLRKLGTAVLEYEQMMTELMLNFKKYHSWLEGEPRLEGDGYTNETNIFKKYFGTSVVNKSGFGSSSGMPGKKSHSLYRSFTYDGPRFEIDYYLVRNGKVMNNTYMLSCADGVVALAYNADMLSNF